MTRSSALLRDGTILSDRYRIIKQIGRGGFGRTYLAEDTQRYRELCVLKEFAPQVESDRDLEKAEELFEREAGILYKLRHDRIPRFEALLRTRIEDKKALFLVQEYIEGKTYWEILKQQGKLSAAEVTELIIELLPVLEYIHSQNLIHRDISPDNLIRRDVDGKPVLIDFGCVKIAANAVSRSTGRSITLIGKKGYSPEEQMRSGQAFPCSDLYSLAATALVLLTRKQPHELYDPQKGKWHWDKEIELNSSWQKILTKMLAYNPRDRYQSVTKLRNCIETQTETPLDLLISQIRTLVVAPKNISTANITVPLSQVVSQVRYSVSQIASNATNFSRQATRIPSRSELRQIKAWQWGLIVSGVVLIPGLVSFAVIKDKLIQADASLISDSNSSNLALDKREQKRQQEIYQRVLALELEPGVFFKNVDNEFHRQYPELRGIQLSDRSEHKRYRSVWYDIAVNLLERRESERDIQ
ncbi:serine/threonine-protein kinase [Myxosarcina sp. GI1]|uniref:serine/threonine-protein kinase n=1 Tax=Myxosarcina sp. GI1 TaxID=1541065 RepID=UPI000569171D|nr:serine/threonine-protein kinase [Myxosarcina sp. GI1]